IKPKLTNKFTRDMLRIRSTPAVSRQQHLVSSTICLDASEGDVLHCGYKFNARSQTVHNLRGLIELGHYVFVQHSLHASVPRFVKWHAITRPPALELSVRITSTRRAGSTKNIMKPPPPAPDTLPARAPASMAISNVRSISGFDMPSAVNFL